jgi:hypothetical protein
MPCGNDELRGLVPAFLLVGGCVNGYAAQVHAAVLERGAAAAFGLFGISPFELLAIAIAAALTVRAWRTEPGREIGLAGWSLALLTLVPSSTVSWLALVVCVLGLAKGAMRPAAFLIIGVALTALWSSTGLRWLVPLLASLDAALVQLLLSPFVDGLVRHGNVLGHPGGHTIVIIASCATLWMLPKVLLGWAALVLLDGSPTWRWWAARGTLVVAVVVACNLVRLALMAWSADLHANVHGDIGANLYDALLVMSAFLLARRSTTQ